MEILERYRKRRILKHYLRQNFGEEAIMTTGYQTYKAKPVFRKSVLDPAGDSMVIKVEYRGIIFYVRVEFNLKSVTDKYIVYYQLL